MLLQTKPIINHYWLLGLFYLFFCLPSITQAQKSPSTFSATALEISYLHNNHFPLDTTKQSLKFLTPAPYPHKGRIIGLSTISIGSYTAMMLAMNELWYKGYERSKFHFFNDNAGWLQLDKVGHSWTAYCESVLALKLYRWSGVREPHPLWISALIGFSFQTSIEIFDGLSAAWGASPGDIAANALGAGLAVGQDWAWGEQRIWLKYGPTSVSYAHFDANVRKRAVELYGDNFVQNVLKDYNAQTYWLSVNIHSFLPQHNQSFPKWLNVAFGYGTDNIFGAERNIWEDEAGNVYDYSHIPRYRQYFVSLDVDLSKIDTNSRFLNSVLYALNLWKFPTPTLEMGPQGKPKFYWFYY